MLARMAPTTASASRVVQYYRQRPEPRAGKSRRATIRARPCRGGGCRRRRHLAANKAGGSTRHPPNQQRSYNASTHSRDPSRSRWGRTRSSPPPDLHHCGLRLLSHGLGRERRLGQAQASKDERHDLVPAAADRHHWVLFPPLSLPRSPPLGYACTLDFF
jgi:hypothetical protein